MGLQELRKIGIGKLIGEGKLTDLLFEAIEEDNPELMKAFTILGANVREAQGISGNTPLHRAVSKGYLDVVKTMFEYGRFADPNIADTNGYTLLHAAAYNNHKDIVEYLLSKGANPCVKTKKDSALLISELADKFPIDLTSDEEIKDMLRKAMKKKGCG